MHGFFSLPNSLSLSRILFGAVALLAIGNGFLNAAIVMIALALLTDMADGIVARRMGATGELGRSLDRTCDSIFQLSVFLAFLLQGWMPLWAAVTVYSVDIALPYLRSFAKQFHAVPPSKVFDFAKSAVYWVSLIAIVVVAELHGPGFTFGGVHVFSAIFAADALLALMVLTVFLHVLVDAKRRLAN